MTFIEIISSNDIDEEIAEEIYNVINPFYLSDEMHAIKFPIIIDKLISILVNPDCIMEVKYKNNTKQYIDTVMVIKESRIYSLKTNYPKEYGIIRRLIESADAY